MFWWATHRLLERKDSEFRTQEYRQDGMLVLSKRDDRGSADISTFILFTDQRVRTQGSVNGINVRTGVGN